MSESLRTLLEDDNGLWTTALDGQGGGRAIEPHEAQSHQGPVWVHVDRGVPKGRDWLTKGAGLADTIVEALLAEESRPRVSSFDGGVLINLRGVNLNPGADPEDMVSLRLWLEPNRIISVRHRRLQAVGRLADALDVRKGPRNPQEFVCSLVEQLIDLIGPVVDKLEDAIDEIDEHALQGKQRGTPRELAENRRRIVSLRRYIAPQRDALARLSSDVTLPFSPETRIKLRESSDRMTRITEDLDAVRERAAVTQEQLVSQASEVLNHRMYILAIVTAVFLPLGLLTGLFGINVGGIPLAENEHGFQLIVAVLAGLTVVEIALFKKLGLL
ncbi:MAG: zinc transporter [Hyphomicrobiaceae bacterium]|jgi:zinc transporter